MKIRHGFVSNSSSSSFLIKGGDIGEYAKSMLESIIVDRKEWLESSKEKRESKKVCALWKNNLKIALKIKDVQQGTIGIVMPSCNYDTYLFVNSGNLYITTCNNVEWDFHEINYEYAADGEVRDAIHSNLKSAYFYDVRNGIVHSYEIWEDIVEGQDPKCKGICPKCKKYYGNYVVDREGNQLCGRCFRKIGVSEEAQLEKKRKRIDNPITSLSLDN